MEFVRTIFWNKDHGAVVPMDRLLGIDSSNHSHGVCEICCRESLDTAFVGASDNIRRLAQLDISSSTVRQIVEQEGRAIRFWRPRAGIAATTWLDTESCDRSLLAMAEPLRIECPGAVYHAINRVSDFK